MSKIKGNIWLRGEGGGSRPLLKVLGPWSWSAHLDPNLHHTIRVPIPPPIGGIQASVHKISVRCVKKRHRGGRTGSQRLLLLLYDDRHWFLFHWFNIKYLIICLNVNMWLKIWANAGLEITCILFHVSSHFNTILKSMSPEFLKCFLLRGRGGPRPVSQIFPFF